MTAVTVNVIPAPPVPPLFLSDLAAAMIGPTVVVNSCCQHERRAHSRIGCTGTIGFDLLRCGCGRPFLAWRAL
jgi:hypothetical protein